MTQGFHRLPSLHLLVAFEAVARLGGFRRAAKELCLTDSAVSHRIRDLEALLGVALFDRHTRSVDLTEQGREFLMHVRSGLESLQSGARVFHAPKERVRLSILPSFARFWLLPRLVQFQRTRPEIALEISSTTRCVDVAKGEADMAIRFGRPPAGPVIFEKILDDEWFPVASPDYLERLGVGDLSELLSRAVLIGHERQPWAPWIETAGIGAINDAHTMTFSDTGMMVDAALRCDGIALVRRSLAEESIALGRLARISDVSIPSEAAYYLIATSTGLRRRPQREVYDWIRHLAHDYQGDAGENARDGHNLPDNIGFREKYGA